MRRAAATARPPAPAVDPGLRAGATAAGGDLVDAVLVGVEQPLGQRRPGSAGRSISPTGRHGSDPAQEQRLCPVQVADAGQVPLVQQCLADRSRPGRPGAAARPRPRPSPGPSRSGPRWPTTRSSCSVGTTSTTPSRYPIAWRWSLAEDEPDPVITRQVVAGRPDPPGSVHAQVRVDGDPAVHPGQQVLAPGDGAGHGPPGQVGRGEPRHPEVAAAQQRGRSAPHPAGARCARPHRPRACGKHRTSSRLPHGRRRFGVVASGSSLAGRCFGVVASGRRFWAAAGSPDRRPPPEPSRDLAAVVSRGPIREG